MFIKIKAASNIDLSRVSRMNVRCLFVFVIAFIYECMSGKVLIIAGDDSSGICSYIGHVQRNGE